MPSDDEGGDTMSAFAGDDAGHGDTMRLYWASLPEDHRRRYAAVEALKIDRGGITDVAGVLGVSRRTIDTGIRALQATDRGDGAPPQHEAAKGAGLPLARAAHQAEAEVAAAEAQVVEERAAQQASGQAYPEQRQGPGRPPALMQHNRGALAALTRAMAGRDQAQARQGKARALIRALDEPYHPDDTGADPSATARAPECTPGEDLTPTGGHRRCRGLAGAGTGGHSQAADRRAAGDHRLIARMPLAPRPRRRRPPQARVPDLMPLAA